MDGYDLIVVGRRRDRLEALASSLPDVVGQSRTLLLVHQTPGVRTAHRGLAARYDKLAVVYRGAAALRAITLWLKAVGDTP